MFVFRKIWRALFSWNTRFEIRPFALLPTNFTWKIITFPFCFPSNDIVSTFNLYSWYTLFNEVDWWSYQIALFTFFENSICFINYIQATWRILRVDILSPLFMDYHWSKVQHHTIYGIWDFRGVCTALQLKHECKWNIVC